MILGVVEVAALLKQTGKVLVAGCSPDSAQNIAAFLTSAKMKDMDKKAVTNKLRPVCKKTLFLCTEPFRAEKVQCLKTALLRKIYGRFTPKAQEVLNDLDNLLGPRQHAYGVLSNLDVLCNKTSCKNKEVANHLLEWVLTGYWLSSQAALLFFVLLEDSCLKDFKSMLY